MERKYSTKLSPPSPTMAPPENIAVEVSDGRLVLDNLNQSVKELHEIVSLLEIKLEPILGQGPTPIEEEAEKAREFDARMLQEISSSRSGVREANVRLARLVNAIRI